MLALIGFGAVRSNAGPELQALVERYQIPFVTTLDGKGIISEHHPLSIGVFCDSGHKPARKAFLAADVDPGGRQFLRPARHIRLSRRSVRGQEAHPHQHRHRRDRQGLQGRCRDHRRRQAGHRGAACEDDTPARPEHPPQPSSGTTTAEQRITHLIGKIHPGQLAQALSQQLPDNAIVLADAGAHLAWLGYYLELSTGQSFRKPGGFGPMAGNVNGALGVKCAHPDRPVIVGCGDGCYLLSGFELLTAVQYDIPVIWIIFNDNEFKLIKLYQLSRLWRDRPGGVRKPRLRGLRPGVRRPRLPGRDARGIRGRTGGSAGARQARHHRRPHHPSCASRSTARRPKASWPAWSK